MDGKIDPSELVKRLDDSFPSFEELRDSGTKSGIKFRTMMAFNLARGGKDWFPKERSTDIEDHHLFPKDWVMNNREAGEDKATWVALRDSVLNRILVSYEANRQVGASSPPSYLGNLTKEQKQKLQIPDSFTEPISTPLKKSVFEGLLKDRYKLLRKDFIDHVTIGLGAKTAV